MAKKDFTVTSKGQSFTVPKGHFVGTSPHVAMRLPTVFKNPDDVRKDYLGLMHSSFFTTKVPILFSRFCYLQQYILG